MVPSTSDMPNTDCCRRLRDALCNDAFPLIYDSHIQEVQLRLSEVGGIAVVRYCPFCGRKLESGRSKLFTRPTDADREDVRRRLHGFTTLEEVTATLGEPDREGTGGGFSS